MAEKPRSYPSRRYGATYKPTGTLKSAAEDIKKDPLEAIHTTLGGLGLLPAAGIPFDIADAAIYGLEALFAKDAEARKGALTGMTLAGAAAVPFWGWAPGLAKVGKNLTKASDEVMSLSKEAQEIAKKAEDALAKLSPNPSSKELADLDKLNNAFNDIVNKQLPKAQEKFNDLLTEAEEGLRAAQTNTVKGVEGSTGGMSVKQRTKYLQETQELVSDIKAASQKEIAKFKEIRTAAKQNVKGAGKNVTKATDDVGYVKYSQDVAARGKLPPATQKRLNKLDDELGVTAKNQPFEQRRAADFAANNPRPTSIEPYIPSTTNVSNIPPRVSTVKTIPRPEIGPTLRPTPTKPSIGGQPPRMSSTQIKEINPTATRTTTDTRARGSDRAEQVLKSRQQQRAFGSQKNIDDILYEGERFRLPAPPTTSTGSTIPVPNAGRGMAGATPTPTSTPSKYQMGSFQFLPRPPVNRAAPSATRTYPTPSGSPTVNASTPTRAGRDLPFPNVPTQTVLNTTSTGQRVGPTVGKVPGTSLRYPKTTALAMGGVMGLTAAGRAIQMSRADQQRKENQLRQEEARRQTQREAEEAFSVGQEEAEEAFNASGAKTTPTTRATSSSDTAPNWRDSMPSGRVAPKTLFDAAMPTVPVPPQPSKSKEPVDTPEPGKVAQDGLREKIVNSIDVEKTRKREQDRINRLQLQARRAMGTGTPRGGGLQFLRTEPERLNRIEEGQASIAADQTPRDEALRRARQRMDTVRAAQRGRDQYYQDIVKGGRRRTNSYMVGPAPEIQNQTVRDAFEDTPANRKRIRTMADGQFADLLDEDETKKPRRRRASLLRRR